MSPTTQKALIVTEIGKPVKLIHDQAIPEPGPKQIQIKVKIAGINPHDHKARDHGLFIAENLPAILTNGKYKSSPLWFPVCFVLEYSRMYHFELRGR